MQGVAGINPGRKGQLGTHRGARAICFVALYDVAQADVHLKMKDETISSDSECSCSAVDTHEMPIQVTQLVPL